MHQNPGTQVFSLLASNKRRNGAPRVKEAEFKKPAFSDDGGGKLGKELVQSTSPVLTLHVLKECKQHYALPLPSEHKMMRSLLQERQKQSRQAFATSMLAAHYSCRTAVLGKFHKGNIVSLLTRFQHVCDGSCIERPARLLPACCLPQQLWLKHKNSARSEGCEG